MKFYIIRHGQTDWNKEKRSQGKIDIQLNQKGIEQAKELKKKINNYDIDLIVCSTLSRAKQTAQIINEDRKLPVMYDEALTERNLGEFEGKIIDEKDRDLLIKNGVYNYYTDSEYKGIETLKDLYDRVWNLMDDLKEEYKNKNILIVTHGVVEKAIHTYFNGIQENGDLKKETIKNCEIIEYEI